MNNENWNPRHSLNKGYPYNGVESMRVMQNRPSLRMDEHGKIVINWAEEHFGTVNSKQEDRTDLEDFLLHRLYDFQETLSVAEGQINDILEEKPFIPENYGFELVHKNADITQSPVRIYQSIFDQRYSLFRKPADTTKAFNASKWTLLFKNQNGIFTETEINLPCDRIAYAVFFGLSVAMDASKKGESEPVQEMMPARGTKNYTVRFTRIIYMLDDTEDTIIKEVDVEAENKSDALTRAKFHLETNPDEMVYGVTFEELEVI